MIISILHIKGGVGKSTIASNLAVMHSLEGNSVLLVDADQQGTVSDWVQHRQSLGHPTNWTTIKLSGAAVRNEVLKLNKNYDLILLDAGGRDSPSLRAALSVSDVALIPCPPRSFDLWSMEQLTNLIEESRMINPKLRALAFINFGDSRSADNESAKELLGSIKGIELLPCVIGQRKAFVNASAEGLAACELKPKQGKVVEELNELMNQILSVKLMPA